jgi:hypothetical protein
VGTSEIEQATNDSGTRTHASGSSRKFDDGPWTRRPYSKPATAWPILDVRCMKEPDTWTWLPSLSKPRDGITTFNPYTGA